ncbi:MAG TPA: hypothetical protein VHL77_12900 [Ferruginibacter sp.]|nr:hypothetical protein [Ferruginibacter sp.]
MKYDHFVFNRPIKILQIFSNIFVYTKKDKSFENRKEQLAWKPVASLNGYVKDGELFLPPAILKHPVLERCQLITIKDSLAPAFNYMENMESNDCFELSAPRKLGNFKIKQAEELELHLDYNRFFIGTPKRDNIKLCNLRAGQPVEIITNGKSDFSLTGRRERKFNDQQYIFEYLGDFKTCTVLKEKENPVIKNIPAERKLVDLFKRLW